MDKNKEKQIKKSRRQVRIRAKITGTKARPRFCVAKSNTSMYLQLIDDAAGKTLVSAHSREIKKKKDMKRTELCLELGKLIAKKAGDKKIKEVVFDRAGNKYHGAVKAVADGAREGGLRF